MAKLLRTLAPALACVAFFCFATDLSAASYEPVDRPVFKKFKMPGEKSTKKPAPPSTPVKKTSRPPSSVSAPAAPAPAPQSAQASSSGTSPFMLFGTVGFMRPVSAAPAWADVIKRNSQNPIFQPERYFNKQTSWEKFKTEAEGLDLMAKLNKVNSFFNRFPYITDNKNWGRADYWASPAQFLKKSGDCEDYAIIKYFTLRELGVPADSMRIVVVFDTILNEGHAVLAVKVNGKIYILDNLGRTVMPQEQLRNYQPQFSVNELGRWNQMVPKSGK